MCGVDANGRSGVVAFGQLLGEVAAAQVAAPRLNSTTSKNASEGIVAVPLADLHLLFPAAASFGLMNNTSARWIHPNLKSTRNHPSLFFLLKRKGDRLPNSFRSYCAHVRPMSNEMMNPVVYGDAGA